MNNRYYIRLSRDNIKKNAKMYIPYIFTCVLMTAMLYIIRSLSKNPDFAKFPHGGSVLPTLMKYGSYITAGFAVVIIFYSNSFILQRRNREFGLLNILGMEKRHIAKLLLIEALHIAAITFVGGILLGMGLEKLITVLLSKMLGSYASQLEAHISLSGMLDAVLVIALTFVGVFLYALRTLHFSNPVELLSGAKKGEKEPKTKLFMTISGILFLIGGYGLSFFVADPRETLHLLASAVFFVILGTYFIFIAAIIAMLKLLKKSKKFYYKTKHFTSVSGLIYRMKRNSVGLASVAILSTMVLISVSSTSALMMGIDSQLPDSDAIVTTAYDSGGKQSALLEKRIEEEVKPDRIVKYINATLRLKGRASQKLIPLDEDDFEQNGPYTRVKLGYEGGIKSDDKATISIRTSDSIDTRLLGDHEEDVLFKKDTSDIKDEYYTEKGEVVIEAYDDTFNKEYFEFFGKKYKIRDYKINKQASSDSIGIYVSSNEELLDLVKTFNEVSPFPADEGYDLNVYYKDPIPQSDEKLKNIMDSTKMVNDAVVVSPACYRSEEKAGLMLAYGSLFFIGVFLGTLFVLETILIIYYKQLTEGYEDASRFKIMQNVGMSEDEVRSSIRSQILLVFFLPLIFAVVHTVFAFPMVGRLLAYVGLDNTRTYLKSCLIGFAGYTLLYTVIYLLTAKLYYGIIQKQK